jgi:hypothetical protein
MEVWHCETVDDGARGLEHHVSGERGDPPWVAVADADDLGVHVLFE